MDYDLGDPVERTLTVQVDGAPTDPTSITFTLRSPSGAVTTVTPEKMATGSYRVLLQPEEPGTWQYRWATTGVGQGAETGSFVVGPAWPDPAAPTADDVADVVLTLAPDETGLLPGRFTDQTVPTLGQARRAASNAATEVLVALGGTVRPDLVPYARRVAALGAAADLTLGLRGDDTDGRQRLHETLRARYETALTRLSAALAVPVGEQPGGLDAEPVYWTGSVPLRPGV